MDPLDNMKALMGMWNQSGAAFWTAQQKLFLDMAKGMGAAPGNGKPSELSSPQAPDMAGLTRAGQDFAKLWASAMEISKAATQHLQRGDVPNPIVTEMMGKIFDPRLWFASTDNMDDALNRISEGPRLADLWTVERKFAAIFNAWTTLRQRNLEHNKVMLDGWMCAAGAFAKVMTEKTDNGEKLESWRDVLAVWVEIANRTMLEAQRSDPYLASQRELLKASTTLRLAQQDVAEFYSEMFGYPTRAELDDVHKTVTELRRELRSLRREAAEDKAARQAADHDARKPSHAAAAAAPPQGRGRGRRQRVKSQ
jgi:hypothetical protein